MMIRGDEYLRFLDEEITSQGPAVGMIFPSEEIAGQNPARTAFLIMLVAAIVLGVAGMATLRQAAPQVARSRPEQFNRQSQSVRAAVGISPRAPAPIKPPPKYILQLRGLDGRTYRIESRTGYDIQNKLPPGFRFGHAATELLLWETPQGRFLARIGEGTRFLYTTLVYQEPCWRWLITLDGEHQGYICPDSLGPNLAPTPSSDISIDESTAKAPSQSRDVQEELAPLAPYGYGCATVPGVVRMRSINGSPGRRYRLPLCGSTDSQERVYSLSEVTTPPTVLFRVEPAYSDAARIALFQGTVVLRVEITATGTVRNIHVVEPLGLGLDENAVEAIGRWRFTPAYKDGMPVAVWATIEVSFRLVESSHRAEG